MAGEMVLIGTPLSVVIIELDRVERKDYTVKDWELILFAFENVLSELWEDKGYGYSLVDQRSGKCYLLSKVVKTELAPLVMHIREQLCRLRGVYKTTLSIGKGAETVDPQGILKSAQQADYALRNSDHEESFTEYTGDVSDEVECQEGLQQDQTEESNGYIIEAAQNYIKDNYREPITLSEIADHVHVNPSYLSFLFKKMMGENYLHYLTNVRMKEAARLIKNPKYKIYEVGDLVGYPNPKYFSVLFKKYQGVTPYEYRNKG